jgi:hypothetical protein
LEDAVGHGMQNIVTRSRFEQFMTLLPPGAVNNA